MERRRVTGTLLVPVNCCEEYYGSSGLRNSGIFHHYIKQPMLTHSDRVLHGMNTLSCDLTDAPAVNCDEQLIVITEIMYLFKRWADPY